MWTSAFAFKNCSARLGEQWNCRALTVRRGDTRRAEEDFRERSAKDMIAADYRDLERRQFSVCLTYGWHRRPESFHWHTVQQSYKIAPWHPWGKISREWRHVKNELNNFLLPGCLLPTDMLYYHELLCRQILVSSHWSHLLEQHMAVPSQICRFLILSGHKECFWAPILKTDGGRAGAGINVVDSEQPVAKGTVWAQPHIKITREGSFRFRLSSSTC